MATSSKETPKHHDVHPLTEDIYQGIGGIQQAARGIHIACLNQAQRDYYNGLERDKWIGLKVLGHDPLEVDKEIQESRGVTQGEGDDDVDSSVKISGDSTTNITVQSAEEIPNILKVLAEKTVIDPNEPKPQPPPEEPQRRPEPKPQPPPAHEAPRSKMPTWAKIALGAAIAGSGIGIPSATYMLGKKSSTIINPPSESRTTIGLEIE